MKKIILFLSLCFVTSISLAQDASVEKSTFGIQTGFLGIWVHNESRLSNSIALRSELGLDTGIFGSNANDNIGFVLVPAITLEPRWYYNLNKRQRKSRRIDDNSGNFISIKSTLHPDVTVYSSDNRVNFISDFSIIPTWGIRRNVGKHFTYETGIGVGYVRYLEDYFLNDSEVAVNLHLRLGYRF